MTVYLKKRATHGLVVDDGVPKDRSKDTEWFLASHDLVPAIMVSWHRADSIAVLCM